MDLLVLSVCPSYCGSFFMSLVVEDLFRKVLVFFNDGRSADCDFGLLVRGGELRVLLLCHLGSSSITYLVLEAEVRVPVWSGKCPLLGCRLTLCSHSGRARNSSFLKSTDTSLD